MSKAIKDAFYDENNRRKKEVKFAMVIDDYKLPDKEVWWGKSLGSIPKSQLDKYEFDREEITKGLTPDTSIVYRYYKLRPKQ